MGDLAPIPDLEGFVSVQEGGWTIVARPGDLDTARSCLKLRLVSALINTRRTPPNAISGRGDVIPAARAEAGTEVVVPGAWIREGSGRGMTLRVKGAGREGLIIKALRRGGLAGRVGSGYYGHPRLLAEMARVEDANRRRIPTARAVFGASARIPGEGGAAILATAELEGAVNLAELLRSPATGRVPTRARNTSLARAGRAVRVAHDSGLDHADLNIGNILVAPVGRPAGMRAVAAAVAGGTDGVRSPGAYVIDLGLSRIGVSLGAGRRAANLIRLERSAEKHLGSGPRRIRDAAAFLHGYLAGPSPPDRRFRRALFRALRRRSILITVHRIGWWLRDWGT